VGKGVLELGASAGSFPELSGTVPEVADSSGHVVNPIPGRDALGSGGRAFDLAGVVIGLSDRADVGLSLSRGLHGTVRLKDGGVWSVSASPSLFWYRSEDYAARASAAYSVAVDLRLGGPWPTDEYGDLAASLSAEVGRVRIQQRDGRTDWAPLVRLYFSFRFADLGG
jgi:hypothetical protein